MFSFVLSLLIRIFALSIMIQIVRIVVVVLLTLLVAEPMGAQSRDELLKARLDSALSERYYKTHYDTKDVVRPPGRLMVRTRVNVSGNSVHS